ncbi:hypothetical protein HY643_02680, partial [Candidatus Woesearchaeota archaeon]|nr:hypothetical protein [Candidatus Woesearchaeota archaeon]
MKKKGDIHTDWIISMALFIVFIIIIFTLIKPGATKPGEHKALLTIIEQTILNTEGDTNSIKYEVLKIPFYASATPLGGPTSGNELKIDVTLPPGTNSPNDVNIRDVDGKAKTVTSVSESSVTFIPITLSSDQANPTKFILYNSKGKFLLKKVDKKERNII